MAMARAAACGGGWTPGSASRPGLAASARVEVLCYPPRIFGYVFNPLTVFFCYGADAGLTAILYEVCNTHAERHTYVIPVAAGSTGVIEQTCQKRFFVSPFIGMDCSYHFRIAPPAKKALVSISEDDRRRAAAERRVQRAAASALATTALPQMLVSYPMIDLESDGRYPFRSAAPVAEGRSDISPPQGGTGDRRDDRGAAAHAAEAAMTSETEVERRVSLLRPLWRRLAEAWAGRIAAGQLRLVFPDGSERTYAGAASGPSATLAIARPRLVWRMMSGGELGFAEAFMDGDWSTPDLTALVAFGLVNQDALAKQLKGSLFVRLIAGIRHKINANTRSGARRNISYHYDLGNDFYRLWLDETMTYSSAVFSSPGQTLADRPARQGSLHHRRPRSEASASGCWRSVAAGAALPRSRRRRRELR